MSLYRSLHMNMSNQARVVLWAQRLCAWSRCGRSLLTAIALVTVGTLGCGDNQNTQLQEILNDGDLGPMLTRGGLTLAVGGSGNQDAAVGGAGGSAGAGAAGRGVD